MRFGMILLKGVAAAVVTGMAALIILPTLARAEHHRSHRASCGSNLKQLAAGAMMYAQDYDERLPHAENWRLSLRPYLKNDRLWWCPEDPRPVKRREGMGSYAGNAHLAGVALDRLARPEHEPLFFEARGIGRNGLSTGANFTPHRDGKATMAFADGHVPRPSSIFHLRTHPPLLLSGPLPER